MEYTFARCKAHIEVARPQYLGKSAEPSSILMPEVPSNRIQPRVENQGILANPDAHVVVTICRRAPYAAGEICIGIDKRIAGHKTCGRIDVFNMHQIQVSVVHSRSGELRHPSSGTQVDIV